MSHREDFADADWSKMERHQRERTALAESWMGLTHMRGGQTVVDIGSGPGWFVRLYARRVAPDGWVYAVEASPKAVAYLRRTLEEEGIHNVQIVAKDAQQPLQEVPLADIVTITDVLHHLDHPEQFLRNVRERLRPDGKLLIAEFSPQGSGSLGPPLSERLDLEQVTVLLEATGFQWFIQQQQAFEHYCLLAQPR
ncbi:MAG: class I SAM-dependent methyltransferase [Firmicutes bacterium]|nr:class I SAM-dependent methyltransferase [Bacillota bacterium]